MSSDSRCFLDVSVSGLTIGRIVVALHWERVPRTCANFRALCTGEAGIGKGSEKPLHYKNTCFHRVIRDFMVQSGDFVNNNGTGGESIYGPVFDDEDLEAKHDKPFLLSMANRGRDTNGSQFFITTAEAPHLDKLHVVFGHVVSGKEVVKQIEQLDVDKKDRPLQDVRIVNCGELVRKKNEASVKAKKAKKSKKAKKRRNKSSSDDSDSESNEDRKGRRKSKKKRSKKKNREEDSDENDNEKEQGEIKDDREEEEESEPHPLVRLSNIDPDEIPDIPSNSFLMRNTQPHGDKKDRKSRDKDEKEVKKPRREDKERSRHRNDESYRGRHSDSRDKRGFGEEARSRDRDRGDSNKGRRVIKGRGNMQYERRFRSRSRTPPHWKNEQRRTISLAEFQQQQKEKKARQEEMEKRAEERQRRHEQQQREEKEKFQWERMERERRELERRQDNERKGKEPDNSGSDESSEDEDNRSRRHRRFEEFRDKSNEAIEEKKDFRKASKHRSRSPMRERRARQSS